MADDVKQEQTAQEVDYKAEYEKAKSLLSKANSEAADYKRQLQAKMSDDEKAKAELESREEYYKSLEKENSSIKISKELAFIGDEKLVDTLAGKFVDGDTLGAIKEMAKYVKTLKENTIKEVKAELMRTNPTPAPAQSGSTVTKEQFDKMTYTERVNFSNNYPDEYKKFTN